MKAPLLSLVLMAAAGPAAAVTMVQTDWSGGPGVQGPVTRWGSSFWSDSLTDCTWSGEVRLDVAYDPVVHEVDGDYQACDRLATADLDGDGDIDMAAGNLAGDGQPVWWENEDGSGTSWRRHDLSGSAAYVACGDIDGDGDADILGVMWSGQGRVVWWENDGGWTGHVIEGQFVGGNSALLSDLDGDGSLDVLATGEYEYMTCWLNDGTGGSWERHRLDTGTAASSPAVGDLDGDGDRDVAAVDYSRGDLYWWASSGDGTGWVRYHVAGGLRSPLGTCIADLDGDGDMDIVLPQLGADRLSWWENGGSGTAWTEREIAGGFGGACSACAVDVDGDGDMDVHATAQDDGELAWFENRGNRWVKHLLESDMTWASAATHADVDGDGRQDLLGTSYYRNIVNWYSPCRMPLSATLTSSVLDTGGIPSWGEMSWTARIPLGTSVGFQVRASSDSVYMGAWSDTLQLPGELGDVLPEGFRYFQYRAVLRRMTTDLVPAVESVSVSYDLGAAPGVPEGYQLHPPYPNPAEGSASVGFDLPIEGRTTVSVFDLTGRMVSRPMSGITLPGSYSVVIGDLGPGVYLVRVESDPWSESATLLML